ncbi:hypothetical protein EW146_g10330 [Bondarzewia mesenterica]|uniref:Uncharacterized protein n=1 Tax=Bondarzewia mesenterica TaxID=1095465 RepID=A0A4S4KYR8_9AGAM|nr:hypothetical protein EW146_g10330 [Bondarzewia mesenterica]
MKGLRARAQPCTICPPYEIEEIRFPSTHHSLSNKYCSAPNPKRHPPPRVLPILSEKTQSSRRRARNLWHPNRRYRAHLTTVCVHRALFMNARDVARMQPIPPRHDSLAKPPRDVVRAQ